MSDIHNDYDNFRKMLSLIKFGIDDQMYIVGDIFDRGDKPVELYYEIKKHSNIIPIQGNHDRWLAEYIEQHVSGKRQAPYPYNSFELLEKHLSDTDLCDFSHWILGMPLQVVINIEDRVYLLAHAKTSAPNVLAGEDYYVMGEVDYQYLQNGIAGYISILGHTPTKTIRYWIGEESKSPYDIWCNKKNTLWAIDCGNGYRKKKKGFKLGCLRLNDGQCFYV